MLTFGCAYHIITVGTDMQIVISYESGEPIYEQIKKQIRGMILSGDLIEGAMLPSIRMLAKEINVGIITAKRAYDDLCNEGFCYSMQGKGIFVASVDREMANNYAVKELRVKVEDIKAFAVRNSVDMKIVKQIFKEEMGE